MSSENEKSINDIDDKIKEAKEFISLYRNSQNHTMYDELKYQMAINFLRNQKNPEGKKWL